MPGMDAGRCAVERQFAHGDAHAARALVAQSQDPLVVGGHDQSNIRLRGVAKQGGDAVHVVRRDPDAARPPEDMAVELAGPAHGRRVDDRQQFHEVLDQHAVEEGLVAVLEDGQADELLQVVSLGPQMLQFQGDLLFNRQGRGGHQAMQIELFALLRGEGRSLVVHRVAKQLCAAVGRFYRGTRGCREGSPWNQSSFVLIRVLWRALADPGVSASAVFVGGSAFAWLAYAKAAMTSGAVRHSANNSEKSAPLSTPLFTVAVSFVSPRRTVPTRRLSRKTNRK